MEMQQYEYALPRIPEVYGSPRNMDASTLWTCSMVPMVCGLEGFYYSAEVLVESLLIYYKPRPNQPRVDCLH